MPVCSLEFVLAVILLSAVFLYLPTKSLRRCALTVANIYFISTYLSNLASVVALVLFLGSGYLVALALWRTPRRAVFRAYLLVLLTAFIWLQRYLPSDAPLPGAWLRHSIRIVGLSYMLFRQIHFLVDVLEDQIGRVSVLAYLNYQLNLFGLLAGPIQRYQDFGVFWETLAPAHAKPYDVSAAFLRLFVGVIKVAGIGAVLQFGLEKFTSQLHYFDTVAPASPGAAMVAFAAVFYLFPLYMYFNFSGYCDLVIGAGCLVGARMPENFQKPYLSRNMIDFWVRWHRTLGFWIRDYLFMPMYKVLASRWPRSAPSLAFLCYFVAFFFAGVWHGSDRSYMVFGLLHGAGASAAKLWEMFIVKRKGRPGLKAYMQSRAIRFAAIFATLHYFCFTMLFFGGELKACMMPIRVLVNSFK